MKHNTLETLIGALVILVSTYFVYFAYQSSNSGHSSSYIVKASFSKVDGLAIGNDVRLSGVRVGTVKHMSINPQTYLAEVELSIAHHIKLPLDSSVKIASESFLGGKYIDISPGSEEEFIQDGGALIYTQSSVNLEELLGRFIFSVSDSKKS